MLQRLQQLSGQRGERRRGRALRRGEQPLREQRSVSQARLTTDYFLGVWGTDPSHVWALGGQGILFWDGSAWTVQAAGPGKNLWSLWGSSARAVWAVGDGGSVLFWDGSSWTPRCSGTAQSLLAVWGSGAERVFAAGENGTLLKWSPPS